MEKQIIKREHDFWDNERIELLKNTICKNASKSELDLAIQIAKQTNLNPFARQIFFIKRWDSGLKKEVMTPQTSVDGLRLIAERTGLYEGQTEAEWCGDDGVWKNVWLSAKAPRAARVGIYKKGMRCAQYVTAHWEEYVQTNKNGQDTMMWAKMPRLMLAKCAESLALRKVFPQEMSGIYTFEEMPDHRGNNVDNDNAIIDVSQPESIPVTDEQLNTLYGLLEHSYVKIDQVKEYIQKLGLKTSRDLNFEQWKNICNWIEQHKKPEQEE